MIIGSQDKRSIRNFNLISDLVVLKSNNHWKIIACYLYFTQNDCGYATIGTYSTEEKAIKVLDMIENAHGNIAFTDEIVFRMPQDSEV